VREAILDQISNGRLPAQTRINESSLANDLGVSRTPLREALMNLEADGFIVSSPGRGFFVAPLTVQEVREIYPIVAQLEGLALISSPAQPDLGQLAAVNDEMDACRDDPGRCLDLDSSFHRMLVAPCSNGRLLDLIAGQKRVMHRYEYAYMRVTAANRFAARTIPSSVQEHRAIIERLSAGDAQGAMVALEANWRNGMERLIEILEHAERETISGDQDPDRQATAEAPPPRSDVGWRA
jgi:DNA-binding GntR family transcriptional regulator